MKKIKKFKIKDYFNKKTGKLLPITFDKKFPIKARRIFFLYGKKNAIRGNHAHKKCTQVFIPIIGKFILDIKTPNLKKKIKLDHSVSSFVMVPPKYWCKVKFKNKDSVLMVACDKNYDENDYIRNFKKYIKYLKKK